MKGKWTITGSIVAVLLLALAVSLTRAQGPEPPGEGVEPQGDLSIEAIVGGVIPIQGRLTDASGNPLNGNYSITASIYNVSSGGTALCSKTQTVSVSGGLFNMTIDNCTSSHINGQQLWLGIKVGTDAAMTPRQPIYPVPYAWSLRPGAHIVGQNDNIAYPILHVNNTGLGRAIHALTNGHTAIEGWNGNTASGKWGVWGGSANGIGVEGYTASTDGYGVAGFQTGYSAADQTYYEESGGLFGGRNGVIGISKQAVGYGVIGWHKATTWGVGVHGRTDSTSGWAGYFTSSTGNGVYISAPAGKTGLNVASGTKNAVVRTDSGSRLLYTEESTEVWFTDYGFGKLQNGVAVIAIDPIFAQTVNLEEPYHVFVQPYGDASLYVTNRTPTGFEVRLHDGDPNVEFSYRIVARRLGYEGTRLERAPWADNDPNLYPEKRATWEAQQGGAP